MFFNCCNEKKSRDDARHRRAAVNLIDVGDIGTRAQPIYRSLYRLQY